MKSLSLSAPRQLHSATDTLSTRKGLALLGFIRSTRSRPFVQSRAGTDRVFGGKPGPGGGRHVRDPSHQAPQAGAHSSLCDCSWEGLVSARNYHVIAVKQIKRISRFIVFRFAAYQWNYRSGTAPDRLSTSTALAAHLKRFIGPLLHSVQGCLDQHVIPAYGLQARHMALLVDPDIDHNVALNVLVLGLFGVVVGPAVSNSPVDCVPTCSGLDSTGMPSAVAMATTLNNASFGVGKLFGYKTGMRSARWSQTGRPRRYQIRRYFHCSRPSGMPQQKAGWPHVLCASATLPCPLICRLEQFIVLDLVRDTCLGYRNRRSLDEQLVGLSRRKLHP